MDRMPSECVPRHNLAGSQSTNGSPSGPIGANCVTATDQGSSQGQQVAGGQQQPCTQQAANYSIPGIVHYLQHEWQRFEVQRQGWDVERAELQARIALLQGERKGQENLKNDLVRRIKMLEYCLRQERAKYHKLKFGVDPPNLGPPTDDLKELNCDLEESLMSGDSGTQSGVNWKQGRQLLRQYLQEIGYTDTIIDVRSNRVRSLLGLNTTPSLDEPTPNDKQTQQQNKTGPRRTGPAPAGSLVTDAEASVLATFEFLNEQRDARNNEEEGDEDEDEEELGEDMDAARGPGPFVIDSETEEVLAEFDFLSTHPTGEQKDGSPWRPGL